MRLGRSKSQAPAAALSLPERSENVLLTTRQGGRIPARVVERGDDSLLVAITVPTGELAAAQLQDMILEYASPRGRTTLHGTFAVEDPSEPDVLRMSSPRSVEVLQERNFVRIEAARPVVVYGGAERPKIESFTVDISGGGLLLAGPDTLVIGEDVRFQLSLTAGEPPISGTARVVRIDGRGRRAVEFASISDLDRRRLVHFIFECQRAERHRGLNEG
jgi:c-di-GMP-binding flagellar brake protein YcgR